MTRLPALAALCGTSCSLLLVDRPPPNHRDLSSFDCTSSVVAPVLDLVAGGAVGGLGLAFAAGADPKDLTFGSKGTAAVAVGVLALSAVSAAYGFAGTADCRAAQRALNERRRGSASATAHD